ncbi:hypothetical protein FSP39_015673 [Pinctada imbricata]|uniref:Uncharacterized protein n=1 Tax=Pinctada imbricata TaxID=66713 RepID=A0AA88XJ21_PINIB|nr:hypothetical protein FSP39_015673 [Pinctada imbricata]
MPGLRVGLVITLSISVATAQLALDLCTFNPVVNGCSIPGQLPAPYKTDFTPACNRHDICYACVSIKCYVILRTYPGPKILNLSEVQRKITPIFIIKFFEKCLKIKFFMLF